MCAIIGCLGKNLPHEKQFKKARDTMIHRGPDDEGIYYAPEEGIALGHRRLSIIDLTKSGNQPFFSNDERYCITFNGEIYNYLELKKVLKNFYDFKTNTDTEVLLATYLRWGTQCPQKLNGMFAFAIWDRKERTLFAARDRVGIKPFYFYEQSGMFAFASEIKGLLALGVKREQNDSVLFDYLYHGFYDHRKETFFKNINRLSSGNFLVWKDGVIRIKQYWDVSENIQSFKVINKEKAQERFRDLLGDSIKLRFRSDVPVGINLSSGLDSNTLLHYSKKITGRDVHTFSRHLESEKYNECPFIDEILNKEQKRKWHICTLEPQEAFEGAKEMNQIQGEPYGGILTIGNMKTHEEARNRGVTVILEGQGLDELLAGYRYYGVEHKKDKEKRDVRQLLDEYSQDMSPLLFRDILDKNFVKKHVSERLSFNMPFGSNLLNAQYRDLRFTKLPRVLRFNDHVSMAYGRELRVPYLDHRIVEFCFSLPPEYKIRHGEYKVLMREAMKEYLPDAVYTKPKKTFGAIQIEWLRSHLKEEVYTLLESKKFKERPYWDHGKLQEKISNFYAGAGTNSYFLWQCINLELWLENFID